MLEILPYLLMFPCVMKFGGSNPPTYSPAFDQHANCCRGGPDKPARGPGQEPALTLRREGQALTQFLNSTCLVITLLVNLPE